MFNSQPAGAPPPPRDNRSPFMKAVSGLANILALMVAFLGTPVFFGETSSAVGEYTAQSYGYYWLDASVVVWAGLCFVLIFLLARVLLHSVVMMLAVSTAKRYL